MLKLAARARRVWDHHRPWIVQAKTGRSSPSLTAHRGASAHAQLLHANRTLYGEQKVVDPPAHLAPLSVTSPLPEQEQKHGHQWENKWVPALKAYHAEHGHVRVPNNYVTECGEKLKLGQLASKLRSREYYVKDNPERKAWLDELGFFSTQPRSFLLVVIEWLRQPWIYPIRGGRRDFPGDRMENVQRRFDSQSGKCPICEEELDHTRLSDGSYVHLDHVLPYSLGGSSVRLNMNLVHQRCNASKGNTFDWRQVGNASKLYVRYMMGRLFVREPDEQTAMVGELRGPGTVEDTVSAGAAMQMEPTASRRRCHSAMSSDGAAAETGAGGVHDGSGEAAKGATDMSARDDAEVVGATTTTSSRDMPNSGSTISSSSCSGRSGPQAKRLSLGGRGIDAAPGV